MDKSWEEIAAMLPVQPCEELEQYVMSSIYDEGYLGENLILYHRESIDIADEIMRTMTPEDWENREKTRRRRWGAKCTCSMCEKEFTAGYQKDGIVLAQGEDGQIYTGFIEHEDESAIFLENGDEVICPNCMYNATVTPRRDLKSGRTYRRMQTEVVDAGDYTGVMFWMVTRRQDARGTDETYFVPYKALVIDRNGKLMLFKAEMNDGNIESNKWKLLRRVHDPMQDTYYSYDSDAVSGRVIGGWVWSYGPDMVGKTGEKTALDEYIGAGGGWVGAYLLFWQKHRQVENLMRHGFSKAVQEEIDYNLDRLAYHNDPRKPEIKWVDWNEVKPHKMLGMSKDAFRAVKKAGWGREDARTWGIWRSVMKNPDALQYEMCRQKVGTKDIWSLLVMVQAGWNDLDPNRVVRYLEKKKLLRDGVQNLIDYRLMLRDAGLAETSETLWPRDLIAAHDRLVETVAATMELSATGDFLKTFVKLRALEWTDGKLCIVIPKRDQDLKDEGETLRHCVGMYGKQHCSGKPIFFVRHYRRPERSYYTLNIDMTGSEPEELQLHGYGNERHGDCKQYVHKIKKEVRDFCDRWEKEVLYPWWRQRVNREEAISEINNKKAG